MSSSNSTTKRCSKCGFTCEIKTADQYFNKDNHAKDGLQHWCNTCRAVYRAEHREEHSVRKNIYYSEHKEEARVRDAIYRANHSDEIRAYAKSYYVNHREKVRTRHSIYANAHRKEARIRDSAYSATLKGKLNNRARNHRRRARNRAAGGTLTTSDLKQVLAAHTNKEGQLICANPNCPYPGHVIEGGKYHLDHFMPLDKGGTNTPGNFRVMHPRCNLTKSNKLPREIGMLI